MSRSIEAASLLPGEEALLVDSRIVKDPAQYGVIIRYEGPWAVVVPRDDAARRQALRRRSAVTEGRRARPTRGPG